MLLLPLVTPQLPSPTLHSTSLVRDKVMNQAVSPGTRELVGERDPGTSAFGSQLTPPRPSKLPSSSVTSAENEGVVPCKPQGPSNY